MTSQHRGLGRGLDALIPAAPKAAGVDTVDIDLIAPNPEQPRTQFDAEALQELADSIREHGVLQPVIVTRAASDLGPATYQLIAGERRLQAARIAGIARMPVVVKEAAGRELLELALVENIQRRDLNPLEEAVAFQRLQDQFGMSQDEIAQRVGRGRAAVSNTMRLLSLEEDIRASIASGQISEGHARALLQIDDAAVRLDAWRRIVSDALTVRQAEEIAKALKATSAPLPATPGSRTATPVTIDPELRAIESDLRRTLAAKVSIVRYAGGGRIIINFHSDDELDTIVERILRPAL